jgi:exodeoxyribonuclease VII large subunit
MQSMPDNNLQPTRNIFTVSQLNANVRRLLESEFSLIWIEGEISNLAQPTSGHIYFSLKDAKGQVSCAMFKGRKQLLRFNPENGQQVLVRAKVSLYEARGNFQLIAEHMEEAGDGVLRRAFEDLKAKLAAEGLFDEELKQAVPELPQRIGVITSATGAAIRDVLSVLQRRFPAIPVLVYPVAVQGDKAATEIAKTIQLAAERQDCDVLLLVRGGGSLEDLWAYNEEVVARAIVDCDIPIISGIGHEVDFTIADFSADVRAATPSAAAELISPDQDAYLQSFIWYQQRLAQLISEKIKRYNEQLNWLDKRLKQQHPVSYLQQQSQKLDELEQKLHMAWQYLLKDQQHKLQNTLGRLLSASPKHSIASGHQRTHELTHRLNQASLSVFHDKKQQLAALSRTMQAISPLQTLSRGYAIVTNESGKSLTKSSQVKSGDTVYTRLHSGQLISRVEKIIKK